MNCKHSDIFMSVSRDPIYIPYMRKYWHNYINLVICLKSGRNALLVEFKFGVLLRYVIAYLSLYAILRNIFLEMLYS